MDITDSGRYYTFEGRLASFQSAQPLSKRRTSNVSSKAPRSIKWPHSSLAPEQMAKAGFFHYPTQENPDNTVCYLCRKSLDGWEEEDDPLSEHLKHSPDCGWAIVASIDAREEELSQEYPLSMRMIEARKETFGDRWPHENKKGWKCKVKQMVDAGWKYTPTSEYDDMATCAYCELALDGWEPSDKPLDEHHNRSPDCAFFTLIAEHQQTANTPKKLTKGRKPRASKASRLSVQSTNTIASEALSITDLPPDEDDSVVTTATSGTVISQSGRKMAKGKKLPKGRKTKSKKEDVVEVSVNMEPEDADFEVKVEVPKITRGQKRSSEEMYETSILTHVQPPPAKRRGTRNTRGSVAAVDESLTPCIEKDAEEVMSPVDVIIPDKAVPNRKRGRPSNAKTQRNPSSASTASKASMRMAAPDDDEIDKALQADLERPLTDEEDGYLTNSNPRGESRLKKSIIAASTAPVHKVTRGSKAQKDYEMFAAQEVFIDEGAIDAELQAMEVEEAAPLPKAKGAKGKQTRKPSAKQQAAAKREADATQAEVNVVGNVIPDSTDVGTGQESSSHLKSRKGPVADSLATSRKVPGRMTRASTISMNETYVSAISGYKEVHDSGNDSDASIASNSTVVVRGAKRRGSNMKNATGDKRAMVRNIEDVVNQSMDVTISQQASEEATQKKRTGRPKKVFDTGEPLGTVGSHTTVTTGLQEPSGEQLPVKPGKAKAGKSKGKGKADPNLPATTDIGPPKQSGRPVPESPKQFQKELTPSLSPQSSDAENRPPSSKPSTVNQASQISQVSRIPLAASTPTISPSKRNIIAGLQSSHPWTAVDLDEILLHSPSDTRAGKENTMSTLLADAMVNIKKGELTSSEKRMSVEEWIMYNATLAEEKLKGECERMVGVFESEGGRAMRVLEGVVCTE